jgi:hypothetical protein
MFFPMIFTLSLSFLLAKEEEKVSKMRPTWVLLVATPNREGA